ncbi:hypothetical protein KSP40_PGU015579 [Platanthera guangdongensis]|uniref:Uncharacterized protein n=1 Tax=Platanthera guangdongensis TaxID=2320717 RepID=A0ABR2M045_9ASPA
MLNLVVRLEIMGFLYCSGDKDIGTKAVVEIKDVKKSLGSVFLHIGTIKEGTVEIGSEVDAAVDSNLRQRARNGDWGTIVNKHGYTGAMALTSGAEHKVDTIGD